MDDNEKTVDELYEERLRKAMKDFDGLDLNSVDVKTYSAILKELNTAYKQYRDYHDGERDYLTELRREEEKRQDMEAEIERKEAEHKDQMDLERQKLDQQQKNAKAERKSGFWGGLLKFLGGAAVTGLGTWLGIKQLETAMQMQENAIAEDHEDILAKSPGHKYVPRIDPLKVKL